MISINDFTTQQELGKLYPAMQDLEKKLKAEGVDPDEYMRKQFESVLLNEFDPVTMGVGAMGALAAKKGWDALGGWNGVSNLAKTGWSGLQRTWGDVKAQHGANMMNQDRQNLANLAHKTGSKVSIPTASRSDVQGVGNVATNVQTTLQNLNALGPMVNNHPQVKQLIDTINQSLTSLQQVAQQLGAKPAPTP